MAYYKQDNMGGRRTASRPQGRKRVNGGAGKTVRAHGPGLGTGPVGSRSSVQRAFNAGARAGTVSGAAGRRKK